MKKFGFEEGKNQDRVVRIFGGLGDHLCATPMLRQLKKEKKKVVISAIYHPIFAGNPNVDELIFPDEEPQYAKIDFRDLYRWAFENGFSGRLSEAWCRLFDVKYDGDKLDYTIFPLERDWVKKQFPNADKLILISTTGGVPVIQYADTERTGSAGKRTHTKDWVKDRWEVLVKEIKAKGYKVMQVGGANEEQIEACDVKMFGISYRLTMALLEQCKTWISVDTFLGHGGHAVHKPGIVLYGATDPKMFGHKTNVNIYHPEACLSKDCVQGGEPKFQWLSQALDCKKNGNNRDCMKAITVEEVLSKLEPLL